MFYGTQQGVGIGYSRVMPGGRTMTLPVAADPTPWASNRFALGGGASGTLLGDEHTIRVPIGYIHSAWTLGQNGNNDGGTHEVPSIIEFYQPFRYTQAAAGSLSFQLGVLGSDGVDSPTWVGQAGRNTPLMTTGVTLLTGNNRSGVLRGTVFVYRNGGVAPGNPPIVQASCSNSVSVNLVENSTNNTGTQTPGLDGGGNYVSYPWMALLFWMQSSVAGTSFTFRPGWYRTNNFGQ